MTRAPDTRSPAIFDVFHEALTLDHVQRSALLRRRLGSDDAARKEVEAMVRAHERDVPMRVERRLDAVQRAASQRRPLLEPGTRIEAYRVGELIGEGGMGEVYAGERVDGTFERAVALKVVSGVRESPELVRRFHLERRVLARLVHPDIVGILDGGRLADGRPYLVMPRVVGVPLTDFAVAQALSLEGRLRLLVRVARAVDFAHGRRVIHSDLKPSNVLVTPDGEPRLLDFGIASIIGEPDAALESPNDAGASAGRTTGLRLTPEHAAPEQLRGAPATVASDVFALGILLFELLTGNRPYDVGVSTPGHAVHPGDAVAPAPSAVPSNAPWRVRLRGDVDAIVGRALQHHPADRYASAGHLADDIERHLARRPVLARGGARAYRAARFVQRNRRWAVAGALVALNTAGLLANSIVQRHRASLERADVRADARAARTDADSALALLAGAVARRDAAGPIARPAGATIMRHAAKSQSAAPVAALARITGDSGSIRPAMARAEGRTPDAVATATGDAQTSVSGGTDDGSPVGLRRRRRTAAMRQGTPAAMIAASDSTTVRAFSRARDAQLRLGGATPDVEGARRSLAESRRVLARTLPARHPWLSELDAWEGIAFLLSAHPDSALGRFTSAYRRNATGADRRTVAWSLPSCGIGVAMVQLHDAAAAAPWLLPACPRYVKLRSAHPALVRMVREVRGEVEMHLTAR